MCIRDRSLFEAITRYQDSVVTSFCPSHVELELSAQAKRFIEMGGAMKGWHSFHQDMDRLAHVFNVMDDNKHIPLTRVQCKQKGLLCGSTYTLHDEKKSRDNYTCAIKSMLSEAVKVSAVNGERPFEIALHPAKTIEGLESFTAYTYQRVFEFEAWNSQAIQNFFSQGERSGSIIRFPLSSLELL